MQIVEQFLAEFEAKAAAAAPLAAKHLEPVGGPNCGCRSGCQPAGRFMTRNLGPDHGRQVGEAADLQHVHLGRAALRCQGLLCRPHRTGASVRALQ